MPIYLHLENTSRIFAWVTSISPLILNWREPLLGIHYNFIRTTILLKINVASMMTKRNLFLEDDNNVIYDDESEPVHWEELHCEQHRLSAQWQGLPAGDHFVAPAIKRIVWTKTILRKRRRTKSSDLVESYWLFWYLHTSKARYCSSHIRKGCFKVDQRLKWFLFEGKILWQIRVLTWATIRDTSCAGLITSTCFKQNVAKNIKCFLCKPRLSTTKITSKTDYFWSCWIYQMRSGKGRQRPWIKMPRPLLGFGLTDPGHHNLVNMGRDTQVIVGKNTHSKGLCCR